MKVIVMLWAALLAAGPVFCQTDSLTSRFHFGIDFAGQYTTLHASGTNSATINSVNISNQPGYRLGIIACYELSRHFTMVLNPDLSYDKSSLSIKKFDTANTMYEAPINLGIAAHIRYETSKWKSNPYVLLGPSYETALPAKIIGVRELTRPNVSLDFGIGMEHAFASFVLAPEIRYSYGFTDIGGIAGVSTVQKQTMSLILNFMGRR